MNPRQFVKYMRESLGKDFGGADAAFLSANANQQHAKLHDLSHRMMDTIDGLGDTISLHHDAGLQKLADHENEFSHVQQAFGSQNPVKIHDSSMTRGQSASCTMCDEVYPHVPEPFTGFGPTMER